MAAMAVMEGILKDLVNGRSFVPGDTGVSDSVQGMRFIPPRDCARGYEEAFADDHGCVITAKRIAANKTFSDNERGFGRFLFVFHLGGQRIVEVSGGGAYRLTEPSFSVSYVPSGAVKTSTWKEGSQETAVVIGFWPHDPPEVIATALGAERSLQSFFPTTDHETVWFQQRLSFEMEQAARLILLPHVHPALTSHLRVTKANELLCLGLDAVLSAFDQAGPRSAPLRFKVQQVYKMLEREVREVPPIVELAEMVGLSAGLLAAEFHAQYGMSISEFVAQQRMKMAQHLLVTTNFPLKKIGYEVGYQHASNFCAAFKRHFGQTPTQLRRAAS